MTVLDLHFSQIEDWPELGHCADDKLIQLDSGPLDFASTQVELPALRVLWNRVGASIHNREIHPGPGLLFGFVLQSPKPLKYRGTDLDFGYALVWPLGQEIEYVASTGLCSLVLFVDETLVEQLGWSVEIGGWRQVPTARLHALHATCERATIVARHGFGVGGEEYAARASEASEAKRWRDAILGDLDSCLEPWADGVVQADVNCNGSREYLVVKEIESFVAKNGLGARLPPDALADALGVPRWTLFRAFRAWLGMGPHAYLNLLRLHQLREQLLVATPRDTYVSTRAYALGFTHMGRLSVAYRKHFGESPTETLRRGRSR